MQILSVKEIMPHLYRNLRHKSGQDFLDRQYVHVRSWFHVPPAQGQHLIFFLYRLTWDLQPWWLSKFRLTSGRELNPREIEVLTSDGCSPQVAHAWRKKVFLEKHSRSNWMPYTDKITEIFPYVRTYFWDTIKHKYFDWDPDPVKILIPVRVINTVSTPTSIFK